jgi:hypothetical protein
MPAPNVGQVVAATWARLVTDKPEDQVFNDRWMFDRLTTKNGGLRKVDGGSPIEISLTYATNTTFRSMSDMETLDVQRIDIADAAQFDWREHAGTVTYSVIQEFKSSGEGAKFDLIGALVENGIESHKNDISTAMFGDGTGNSGKNINGLRNLVPQDPSSGIVGGINRGTFTFWRSLAYSGAKTTNDFDNLRARMRTAWNTQSGGVTGNEPTFGVTTQTVFEGYESLLVPNERYDMDDKKNGADLGYNGAKISFKGTKLSYDLACPTGFMWLLNEKFIHLYAASGIFMKLGKEQEPINQHIRVRKVHSILQMVVRQPRRLACIHSIT